MVHPSSGIDWEESCAQAGTTDLMQITFGPLAPAEANTAPWQHRHSPFATRAKEAR
jgi:hypothetical protein